MTLKYATRHAVRRHPLSSKLSAGLIGRERADPDAHRARQERLLSRTLRRAVAIPAYKRLAEKAPSSNLLAYLGEFPLIDRSSLIRRPWAYYPNGGVPKRWWLVAATSGTTGTPVEVFRNVRSVVAEEAFHLQHWHWAGWRRGDRQVLLRGDLIWPVDRREPPYWLHDVAGRQLILSTRHLNEQSCELFFREIERFGASQLRAYPSAAYDLAQLAERHGAKVAFDSVITGSELLHDFQRRAIEQAFDARVYDFYSMTERVAFAAECPLGRMHMNPEYGVVEIVDERGRPTDGEGQIVGTTLHNGVMPLIRYRVADRARWSTEPCDCGRTYPVIERISGRLADCLYDLAGNAVNATVVGFALDHVRHVARAQVAQTAPDLWTIRVVAADGYVAEDGAQILRNLAQFVSTEVRAVVQLVDHIDLLPSGKYKWVSQECPDAGKRRMTTPQVSA
jgi:phenylacetate-CoA ligase